MRGASRSHHRDNASAQSQSDESDANGNFHAVPREDSRVSRTLTMVCTRMLFALEICLLALRVVEPC